MSENYTRKTSEKISNCGTFLTFYENTLSKFSRGSSFSRSSFLENLRCRGLRFLGDLPFLGVFVFEVFAF